MPVNAGEIALPVTCIARYFRARKAAVNRHAFLHCYDRVGRGRVCARSDPKFISVRGSVQRILNGILCIGPGRTIARSRTARHDVEDIGPRQCRQQQRQNEYWIRSYGLPVLCSHKFSPEMPHGEAELYLSRNALNKKAQYHGIEIEDFANRGQEFIEIHGFRRKANKSEHPVPIPGEG